MGNVGERVGDLSAGLETTHTRRFVTPPTTTARPFPSYSSFSDSPSEGGRQLLADLALRRRTEVSRLGRMMRSNGVGNKAGDALTLRMRCVVFFRA